MIVGRSEAFSVGWFWAAEAKCLKRGVKEVVKSVRRGQKGQPSPLRHSSIHQHRRSELLSALKQRLIAGEGTMSSKRSQALPIKPSVADQAFHCRSALPSSLRPSVAAQVSIVEVEADPTIC